MEAEMESLRLTITAATPNALAKAGPSARCGLTAGGGAPGGLRAGGEYKQVCDGSPSACPSAGHPGGG
jgi:hypothetical protein